MKKFGAPRFMSFKGVPKKCFGFTAKVLEGPIPGGGGGGAVLLLPVLRVRRPQRCGTFHDLHSDNNDLETVSTS